MQIEDVEGRECKQGSWSLEEGSKKLRKQVLFQTASLWVMWTDRMPWL